VLSLCLLVVLYYQVTIRFAIVSRSSAFQSLGIVSIFFATVWVIGFRLLGYFILLFVVAHKRCCSPDVEHTKFGDFGIESTDFVCSEIREIHGVSWSVKSYGILYLFYCSFL